MLDRLTHDLRHAARRLRKDWGFTLVVLLSLALGIGANASVFTLVDQLLLRLLPVRAPEQLVQLDWKGDFVGQGWGTTRLLSHPFYRELAASNQVFSGTFARYPARALLSAGGTGQMVLGELVTGSYFGVLGVGAHLGRVLGESDDRKPGAHPVVVLSHDYWKNQLGGPADIVGRTVLLNSHPMKVVGVAAAGFRGIDRVAIPALWVPMMMTAQAIPDLALMDERRVRWLQVFARLRPGVSREAAQVGLQPWFKTMLEADTRHSSWPKVTEERRRAFLKSTLAVLPGGQGPAHLRQGLQSPLLVLLGATGLVLVLACLNVANLSLARGFGRRRELAVRAALGASRPRLLRQLGLEAGLLAVGGGLLGLWLAPIVSGVLVGFFDDTTDVSAAVDLRVLGFACAITALCALLFGVAPALQGSRVQPALAMKQQSAAVTGGTGLRKALVVGQLTLALLLLVGAGLFVRTLQGLRVRGPGFTTTNLLNFPVDTRASGLSEAEGKRVTARLVDELRALPDVQSAGVAGLRLMGGGSRNGRILLDAGSGPKETERLHFNHIDSGFLPTLGVPVTLGRNFDARDVRPDPRGDFRSAIVNEKMARRYFGERSPLGARLGLGTDVDTKVEIEIVGVAGDFHYRGMKEVEAQVYFPIFEGAVDGSTIYVRTRSGSGAAAAAIAALVRTIDPRLPEVKLSTLDAQLDDVLRSQRMLALLTSAFAGLAVLLAVIGLYGVMSFVVTRRTREIGIRMALGALPRSAVALIVRETLGLVVVGVAIALPAVWALGRLVESQLYGVQATDVGTLLAATLLVAAVALGATALPARRAAAVSPTQALRAE
jgi:predicted permease